MPKTKTYEPEFKKKIVRLYLEEGRTIKSLSEEYQLGDGTVRKWVREFCEDDWYSLVEYATVYSREDIRFTFKNGMEVKA